MKYQTILKVSVIILILVFSCYISYTKLDLEISGPNITLSEDSVRNYYEKRALKDISSRIFNLFDLNYYDWCVRTKDEDIKATLNLSGEEVKAGKNEYKCQVIKLDNEHSLYISTITVPILINRSIVNTPYDVASGEIKTISIDPFGTFRRNSYSYAEIRSRDLIARIILAFAALYSFFIIFLWKEVYSFLFPRGIKPPLDLLKERIQSLILWFKGHRKKSLKQRDKND